jgi:hypothetical protein
MEGRMMWRFLPAGTLAAVVLFGSLRSAAAFGAPDVLYEDNFDRLDPGWGESSDMVSVHEGHLQIRPKLGTSQAVQHQGVVLEDGSVSVTIKLVRDDGRVQATGLIFWGTDYQSYYVVDITPDGRYAVTRWAKGRWLYPVSYRRSDAVKRDYNQDNEIRVMTKGNVATVFINGTEVISIKGQPPKGGGLIGLYAESGAGEQTVAEFAHLKITALP